MVRLTKYKHTHIDITSKYFCDDLLLIRHTTCLLFTIPWTNEHWLCRHIITQGTDGETKSVMSM